MCNEQAQWVTLITPYTQKMTLWQDLKTPTYYSST